MADRTWPEKYPPRTKDEWMSLKDSDDPEERLAPANVLKDLGYAPRDFVKWPPEKKFETIFAHQAEAHGEDSLSGGGKKSGGAKPAASKPAPSKGKGASKSNGASKGGKPTSLAARLAAKRNKGKGKGAAKSQPAETAETAPVEEAPEVAVDSGVSSEQLNNLAEAIANLAGALEILGGRLDDIENKIDEVAAFTTETHFAAMHTAATDDEFGTETESLGQLMFAEEEEEGDEGEE